MEQEIKKPILKETDLLDFAAKLWVQRKLFVRNLIIGTIVGVVVALSIPREYTAQVVLAPEVATESGLRGSLGSLASMAGISLGGTSGEDAIYPELYPQIVASAPFLVELFKVHVETQDGELSTNYYDYIYNHQTAPWWSYIIQAGKKVVKSVVALFNGDKKSGDGGEPDPFNLSREQRIVAETIKNSIGVFVNKKDQVTTLSVTAQDPLICATMTDSVKVKLQDAITNYRTKKARIDLEYTEKMYAEAQQNYFQAQREYAVYSDKNQYQIMRSFETEGERLENEMELAFTVYNQMAQQLQLARMKVQERTPAFTEVEPASVPMFPSGLSRTVIVLLWMFLTFIGTAAWLIFKPVIVSFVKNLRKYETLESEKTGE